MSRAERRRELRRQRWMSDQKAAVSRRAKILALRRQLREKHRSRLTMAQKLVFALQLLAYIFWYPILIWLPHDPPDDQRR